MIWRVATVATTTRCESCSRIILGGVIGLFAVDADGVKHRDLRCGLLALRQQVNVRRQREQSAGVSG